MTPRQPFPRGWLKRTRLLHKRMQVAVGLSIRSNSLKIGSHDRGQNIKPGLATQSTPERKTALWHSICGRFMRMHVMFFLEGEWRGGGVIENGSPLAAESNRFYNHRKRRER